MKKKDTAALAALLFIAAAESVLAVGLLKKLQKLAVEKAAAMYPDQLPEEKEPSAEAAAAAAAETEELPEPGNSPEGNDPASEDQLPETEQLPQADSEDE